MKIIDHNHNVKQIFKTLDLITFRLLSRETNVVEFKESFNWGSKDKYARTMAAFANNKGGYLIFGVSNKPKNFVGLQSNNFEDLDEAEITAYLSGLFSPEISYEKFTNEIQGRKVGILYTSELENKPIIAIKNDGNSIKEAEIYYRYNARNDKIKYPELKHLFDQTRASERKSWMSLFEKVSKIGPSNAAIMDMVNGTIEGENNSLLIDRKLISKLKFIKEGNFSEKGKPTLKLIGDIRPITVSDSGTNKADIRITDDPTAPAVREETVLKNYPLEYSELIKELKNRYSDFKMNSQFNKVKQELVKNIKFCHPRYLDPKNPKSSKKDFYSRSIIKEFDNHYTKK